MNRRAVLGVFAAGIAVCIAVAIAQRTSGFPPSGLATALHLCAGLSFIVAGVVAWTRPPSARVGALMCAVGFAWFISDLAYLPSSTAVTVGILEPTIVYALLAHLFLTFPSGRLRSRLDRNVLIVVYAWTILGNLIPDAFFAPPDTGCDCAQNLVVFHRDAAAHTVAVNLHQIANMVLAVLVFILVIDRWRRSTPPARRALAPIVWAAGPIEVAIISLNVVGVVGGLDWLLNISPILTPLALMTLPVGFLIGVVNAELARGAVGNLIVELGRGPLPGSLRDALAAALGDESLSIAYWRPEAREWVDQDGVAVMLPTSGRERVVTFVERDGKPTAALIHDPSLQSDPWLLDAVSSACSLALENERLRADIAAQLEDVRASRARIVEAEDAARRRIERDLHDGAQQRLVSVLLTLRLARGENDGAAPDALRDTLDEAIAGQEKALAELRELAAGIHPAVLTDGGLRPALRAVTELASVDVSLDDVPAERLPDQVEAAAYFVVSEALANVCKHAVAQRASVCVRREDDSLRVEVRDDGKGGADLAAGSGLRGLADRIAALNGRLDIESPPGAGTRVVATIPCA
jgi:hypothetical protein